MSTKYVKYYFKDSPTREVDYVNGAFFLTKKQIFNEVGLFDEKFFFYSEDEDMCYRMRHFGYTILYTKCISILHHQGVSSKGYGNETEKYVFLLYDSKTKYFEKHYGRTTAKLFRVNMMITLSLLFIVNIFRRGLKLKLKPPFSNNELIVKYFVHNLQRLFY